MSVLEGLPLKGSVLDVRFRGLTIERISPRCQVRGLTIVFSCSSAVDVKTRTLFKASFPDKGPDQPVRGARHFTGHEEVSFSFK